MSLYHPHPHPHTNTLQCIGNGISQNSKLATVVHATNMLKIKMQNSIDRLNTNNLLHIGLIDPILFNNLIDPTPFPSPSSSQSNVGNLTKKKIPNL